jgi:transposase InsO family protein
VRGRYHLRPDRTGISLPGGNHRLGEPGGPGLAAVEHDGYRFCLATMEEALARFDKPEIFNTDQGSQFTSGEFTGMLAVAGIRISMDGRGRWIDNVFIERLWRSLKYEDVYLKGDADGREVKAGIG